MVALTIVGEGHAGETEPVCTACAVQPDVNCEMEMEDLAPGPAPRKQALKAGKKRSQKQEQEIRDELAEIYGDTNVRVQAGSGNQITDKGDVRAYGHIRAEAKYTAAESFSLKLDDLAKISGEVGRGEIPVVVIDYLEQGTSMLRDRFAVINFHDLKELLRVSCEHQRPQRTPATRR
jgi:hypothetical protein